MQQNYTEREKESERGIITLMCYSQTGCLLGVLKAGEVMLSLQNFPSAHLEL